MRLRSKNNAVSGVFAVALFIFVGCAIALSGIMSDVDASVLKFGLIAYLFMAVPIFLASFSGRWTTVSVAFSTCRRFSTVGR